MEFDQKSIVDHNILDDSVNFRDVLDKYMIHLKWFILSVLVLLVLAFLKLRKEVPRYEVTAKILISDKEKGSSVNQLAAFEDLGIFGSSNNSLENEIHILTSRRLMMKVVDELRLNVKYFIESSPFDLEIYPDFPLILEFVADSTSNNIHEKVINNVWATFAINIKNSKRFELLDEEGMPQGIYDFGSSFSTNFGRIRINKSDSWQNNIVGQNIIIKVSSLDAVVDKYTRAITVEPTDLSSRVIGISVSESKIGKGIAIINNLIEQYNADAIQDKNQVYKKSTEFLNDRIILITSELNAIENTVEQFKSSKGLIDTRAGADIYLQSSSTNESNLIESNTQIQLLNYMESELNKGNGNDLLPANIGLSNPSITTLIGEYNNLVLQRQRIIKSSTVKNPLIVNIDSQLNVLKGNLKNSLAALRSTLNIQISSLNVQRGKIGSKIASVPKNEKEYTDIVRQQETKNAVYLYLLQKREESILSNAITINKARIINSAYSNGGKVSPNKGVTYLVAVLLGLLLPTGIIFIKDSLDTRVHSEKDLKSLKIPYIGDVPVAKSKKDLMIEEGDNSSIAESFRYIRTNLSFMLDRQSTGKTIFITSTLSGEGKTFCSINLAHSFAISGKRTLLLGIDLRAPKITNYLELEDSLGVTNFVKNENLPIQDLIERDTELENFHVINSGDIPPNPVELLMSKRIDKIFEYAKNNYEYIIVDTAPVGMVTDTIQISKHADVTLYVVKANFLDKRKLHIPFRLNVENKLQNMAMLINGSEETKGAYGYGYGYGKKKSRPWYRY